MENQEQNVAIRLEHKLREINGHCERIRGTKYDSDMINSEMFFDAMIEILKYYRIDTTEFYNKYSKIRKVSMRLIPNYYEIYEEYKKLIKESEFLKRK